MMIMMVLLIMNPFQWWPAKFLIIPAPQERNFLEAPMQQKQPPTVGHICSATGFHISNRTAVRTSSALRYMVTIYNYCRCMYSLLSSFAIRFLTYIHPIDCISYCMQCQSWMYPFQSWTTEMSCAQIADIRQLSRELMSTGIWYPTVKHFPTFASFPSLIKPTQNSIAHMTNPRAINIRIHWSFPLLRVFRIPTQKQKGFGHTLNVILLIIIWNKVVNCNTTVSAAALLPTTIPFPNVNTI